MELHFPTAIAAAILWGCFVGTAGQDYCVGVGIADITGPPVGDAFLGYGEMEPKGEGIQTRLFSRAFIFEQCNSSKPVVFVSTDTAMMDQRVKQYVIQRLQSLYGDIYNTQNVLISAMHTHSGPGGYMQYGLYASKPMGYFDSLSFYSLVDGILESIQRAHDSRQPARMYLTRGQLLNASINRSPSSYEANPAEERAKYSGNTDTDMVLLRIDSAGNSKPIGMINWFAVHPNSMNKTNSLVSGDNKGYASQLFEAQMNPGARPGKGAFVAAFASTNLGDVSPNTKGAKCIDTGKDCDYYTSTCKSVELLIIPSKNAQNCIAFGPGSNMKESTRIIGERQYIKAKELFDSATVNGQELTGDVRSIYQYVDMGNYVVTMRDDNSGKSYNVTTCKPALGNSFGAGTTDGPGPKAIIGPLPLNLHQGDNVGGRVDLIAIGALIGTRRATPQESLCQAPKPILINGVPQIPLLTKNQNVAPLARIVDTQVLKIGNLYILGVPGEPTTMAGRRLREAVRSTVEIFRADSNAQVVIAGLSNVYTHYITTFEEYQKQRYEAASTLYGPHTLSAYIQQFSKLTQALLNKSNLPNGPSPPIYEVSNRTALKDGDTKGRKFGACTIQPENVKPGQRLRASFIAGNPGNDPLRGRSFIDVVRSDDGSIVVNDADFNTELRWRKDEAQLDFIWDLPQGTPKGTFKIIHRGVYIKDGSLVSYAGESQNFAVVN